MNYINIWTVNCLWFCAETRDNQLFQCLLLAGPLRSKLVNKLKMASLRQSYKLLRFSERFTGKGRSFSFYKSKTHSSKLYTTCGVLIGAGTFYYINKMRNSHTVHAYKPRKVSQYIRYKSIKLILLYLIYLDEDGNC